MSRPGSDAVIERWSIVAMCTDPLRARAVQKQLEDHQIPSMRGIYNLPCGGPVVKLYVPEHLQQEGVEIAGGVPDSVVGVPGGRAYGGIQLVLLMDSLFTALGMWLASRSDPMFRKERKFLQSCR